MPDEVGDVGVGLANLVEEVHKGCKLVLVTAISNTINSLRLFIH